MDEESLEDWPRCGQDFLWLRRWTPVLLKWELMYEWANDEDTFIWSWSIHQMRWERSLYGWMSLRRDFSLLGKMNNFLLFQMESFWRPDEWIFPLGQMPPAAQMGWYHVQWGQRGSELDNKWNLQSHTNYEDKWIFEGSPFIPNRFATKKGFSDGEINFSRSIWRTNRKIRPGLPFPRQFPRASLALYWNSNLGHNPPPPAGQMSPSFLMFLGGVAQDFENDGNNVYRRRGGYGCKNRLTSSLSFRSTVNPDFLPGLK